MQTNRHHTKDSEDLGHPTWIGDREGYLRTVPRRVSNVNLEELMSSEDFISNRESPDRLQRKLSNQYLMISSANSAEQSSQQEGAYHKVKYSSIPIAEKMNNEEEEVNYACTRLVGAINLRDEYITYDDNNLVNPFVKSFYDQTETPLHEELKGEVTCSIVEGVYTLSNQQGPISLNVVPVSKFYSDLENLLELCRDDVVKAFANMRLYLLEMKYNLHCMLNSDREGLHTQIPSRDFYSVIKVDNHVHLSACMNQKHLQKFMKKKILTESDQIVAKIGGTEKTLKEVFDSFSINSKNLTIDVLNCFAERIFHRFDRFNSKYNPVGQPILREIFLKTDNYVKGRYFAEICREVFNQLEDGKYLLSEYRISIYGRNYTEWKSLSQWFLEFKLQSKCVKWLIQIPRLYSVYRKTQMIQNFSEMLNNIFEPVFEATLHPDAHPEVSSFLAHVVGFDSVDDESQLEKITSYANYQKVIPENWNSEENPPYSYWSYYIYANICVLNLLRKARGLHTFSFRPHCGETDTKDHLATAFLTAHSINHGIAMRNDPVIQYLFYLEQIGVSLSPLSNNKLFLKFLQTPFSRFFRIGLNVALSTDDPLMLHLTKEPLLEEYSVCAQALDLNVIDLCEVARNSALQSNFEYERKKHWLGENFLSGNPEDHDPTRSNVPAIRYLYRFENYHDEMKYLVKHSNSS